LDPFLLLDEFTVTPPAGFPDHPHRGFETVTYMLHGSFKHEDFCGRTGTINPGDLQWMTAGRAIVHCETPKSDNSHGLQLWVNLSSKEKMIEAKYQEVADKDVPKASQDGINVHVIAGESCGIKSSVYTRTPTMYLDISMEPNKTFVQAVPEEFNGFVYTLEGSALFGNDEMQSDAHHTLILGPGSVLTIKTKESKARFVIIAGKPLNEPVVQQGPFVMNTQQEIMQAMMDYQNCTNGFENAKNWSSQFVKERDSL